VSNLNEEQLKTLRKYRQDLVLREIYWKSPEGRRAYIKNYVERNFGPNGFFTKMSKFRVDGGKSS